MKSNHSMSRLRTVLLAALAVISPSSFAAEPAMSASTPAGAKTQVQGQTAALEAAFAYNPAKRVLQVDYTLRNTGTRALAVFDRGNRHEVSIGRQKLGAIASPAWKATGDDLELSHIAAPLPDPGPISPPSPLALEIKAGGELRGAFRFSVIGSIAPKRLRWCLGVMPLEPAYFDSPSQTDAGQIWRASFAAAGEQDKLCTAWFDIARNAFEP
ncbi:hypothetical protein [Lysobacter sp. CA199]|uniref:hypothetical protein n=1 Tax=Lysobacter sp. CA199 TaxID=3455608 RepID=UPI003F8D2C1B